ncbi:MAG: hypothetical protein U9R79_10550 [Armatimonadota bacterium]|nr:hypothetical protein [Armatimonadota bacterium]
MRPDAKWYAGMGTSMKALCRSAWVAATAATTQPTTGNQIRHRNSTFDATFDTFMAQSLSDGLTRMELITPGPQDHGWDEDPT